MDRLDRKDLKDAPFDVALRGYDKRQVDERIRFLAAELAAAEHALRAAQARAAALEEEVNQMRSGAGASGPGAGSGASRAGSDAGFGARVEKILLIAEEEAREARSQAGAEAAALVEQARAEAEKRRKRAAAEIVARQAEAEKVGAAATEEAEQLRKAAAQEADEVRKTARGQAARLVEQARIEADRLVASATASAGQRERASAQEVQRLAQLRDQVNAELYRAKNVLDGLFPGAVKEVGDEGAAGQHGRSSTR